MYRPILPPILHQNLIVFFFRSALSECSRHWKWTVEWKDRSYLNWFLTKSCADVQIDDVTSRSMTAPPNWDKGRLWQQKRLIFILCEGTRQGVIFCSTIWKLRLALWVVLCPVNEKPNLRSRRLVLFFQKRLHASGGGGTVFNTTASSATVW